jgi:hypothetical protein
MNLASEGNTEEDNSGHVVVQLWYRVGGERGGVMLLMCSASTFLFYSRILVRYLKTTWTFFLLYVYSLPQLPENILLALATGSSLLMLMCVFTRFPIFRVSLQTIESIVLDDLEKPLGLELPRAFLPQDN